MNHPIPKELLTDFINGFFGYGNLNAPYWFIGKEEGGGKKIEENYKRIQTWNHIGRTTTVDLIHYHLSLGFSEKQLSAIQPTWTKLIQILLELESDITITKENRRFYQREKFGRTTCNNCLMELMPMASRSTKLWLWKEIFQDYFEFSDRKKYFSQISPKRRSKLSELIKIHSPKLVLFYSSQKDYIEQWGAISEITDWNWKIICDHFKYAWAKKNGILFVITPHPTTYGLTLDNFSLVGKFIKEELLLNNQQ